MAKHKAVKAPIKSENYNWLTSKDEGNRILVTGHWSGDFVGIIKYGGRELAIITDINGVDREVTYIHPVEFHALY